MQHNIAVVAGFLVLVSGCAPQLPGGDVDVTRSFVIGANICTSEGRRQINPPASLTGRTSQTEAPEESAEAKLATADWVYREHLLAEQVAVQCNVDETEWTHLAASLEKVAIGYYQEAGLSRSEIRAAERRLSAQLGV